jgi:hypothetical protein
LKRERSSHDKQRLKFTPPPLLLPPPLLPCTTTSTLSWTSLHALRLTAARARSVSLPHSGRQQPPQDSVLDYSLILSEAQPAEYQKSTAEEYSFLSLSPEYSYSTTLTGSGERYGTRKSPSPARLSTPGGDDDEAADEQPPAFVNGYKGSLGKTNGRGNTFFLFS